jgi:hypothetical protein
MGIFFHIVYILICGSILLWLLLRKLKKDAAIFATFVAAAYPLYLSILNNRSFIFTVFIGDVIKSIRAMFAPA